MVVWVQVLRALAALAVTIAHAHNAALGLGIGDYVPDFQIGAAGVDLFFVISGFVMVQSSRDLFGMPHASLYFFLRRLARIAPIYWIATALFLFTDVYLMVGTDLATAGLYPRNILTSLLFIPDAQINGGVYPVLTLGWTLNFEMFFYFAFSAALIFRARIAIPLLAVFMVAFGQLMWHVHLPMPIRYWSNPIISEFAFGMLIGWVRIEGLRLPNWSAALISGAGLAWFAASAAIFWLPGPRHLWWGLPAAAMVAGAGLARHDLDGRMRVAAFMVLLGDASYALYLFHPMALRWPVHLIEPATMPYLFYALMLIVSVASAVAIHLLIERPITRRLQKRIAPLVTALYAYFGQARGLALAHATRDIPLLVGLTGAAMFVALLLRPTSPPIPSTPPADPVLTVQQAICTNLRALAERSPELRRTSPECFTAQ